MAKVEEEKALVPVLMVHEQHADEMVEKKYREAQLNNKKKFAMATLINVDGQFQIDDLTPRTAVIDTGASAIILGRSFARRMERCRPPWLHYGDVFITANGQEAPSLGRTKLMLEFVLASGTSEETKFNAYALIADTDAYDVILGMDFMGECFGYMDPLT